MSRTTDDILIDLVYRSLAAPLPDTEAQALADWLAVSADRQVWYQELRDTDRLTSALQHGSVAADQAVRAELLARIREATGIPAETPRPVVHRVHFLKTAWFRYAAAVIVLLGMVLISGTYNEKHPQDQVVTDHPAPVQNEVAPGSDKAILTLANGQQIPLDSTANSLLATKGIENNNAMISYSGAGEDNIINTLATPRGGQYQIRLSDGTKVWLNAASSITYPTVFKGKERKVTISGEVYFEVAKDKTKPFHVKVNELDVEVLGTQFNINSYADEDGVKTTLLEGSVRVNHASGQQLLHPNEQAVVSNGKLALRKVNTEEVIA